MAVFDGLALVISVESNTAENASPDRCDICGILLDRCRRDLKNCHEEADSIAALYKKFNNVVIQLKNPSPAEVQLVWRQCKDKLGNRAFFFTFVGHGE